MEYAEPRIPARKGEPLVLLHGFALCAEVWKPILHYLEREHEVHALTMPGHFGGDPVPAGFAHDIEACLELLEAKLDALGLSDAHIVGNSLGGWFALELARRGRARSVVALAPGGGWTFGSREHRRLLRRFQLTKALLSVGGPLATVLASTSVTRQIFLGDVVARPDRLAPRDAKLFIESAWRCTVYSNVLKALPKQKLAEPFSALPCPVRLVWGAKDRLLPLRGYSEHWRRVLPDAEWVVLEDVGHVQMYDDPQAVAEAILAVTLNAAARTPDIAASALATSVMPESIGAVPATLGRTDLTPLQLAAATQLSSIEADDATLSPVALPDADPSPLATPDSEVRPLALPDDAGLTPLATPDAELSALELPGAELASLELPNADLGSLKVAEAEAQLARVPRKFAEVGARRFPANTNAQTRKRLTKGAKVAPSDA